MLYGFVYFKQIMIFYHEDCWKAGIKGEMEGDIKMLNMYVFYQWIELNESWDKMWRFYYETGMLPMLNNVLKILQKSIYKTIHKYLCVSKYRGRFIF